MYSNLKKWWRASKHNRTPGVFVLEDGTTFLPPVEPLEYLVDHEAKTPKGERIVGYKLLLGEEKDYMSQMRKMLVEDSIRDLNGRSRRAKVPEIAENVHIKKENLNSRRTEV